MRLSATDFLVSSAQLLAIDLEESVEIAAFKTQPRGFETTTRAQYVERASGRRRWYMIWLLLIILGRISAENRVLRTLTHSQYQYWYH